MASEKVRFFPTPADLRQWFATNHETATELWAGFHKKETGKPSITWPESVDEALCCGWIDGIRKRLDESRYMIRFTPRKPTSTWSVININRVAALQREGRMLPAGLKAFEARRENKSGIYAYEQKLVDMPEPYCGRLQKNKAAWKYFQAQSSAVRRRLIWWIVSAKREETRLKRVRELMAHAAKNRPIPLLEREPPKKRRVAGDVPVMTAESSFCSASCSFAVRIAGAQTAARLRPRDVDALPSRPADARIAYGEDPLQFGELRLPAGNGPFPVAIVIHGGCWVSRFATLRNTAALADALRNSGIATWNVEYRRLDNPGGGWPGTLRRRGRRCRPSENTCRDPPTRSCSRRFRRTLCRRAPGLVAGWTLQASRVECAAPAVAPHVSRCRQRWAGPATSATSPPTHVTSAERRSSNNCWVAVRSTWPIATIRHRRCRCCPLNAPSGPYRRRRRHGHAEEVAGRIRRGRAGGRRQRGGRGCP